MIPSYVFSNFFFPGANHLTLQEELFALKNFSMYPFFDFDVIRNITTRVGQTTFLHCRVEQLGDKSVSCFDKIERIAEWSYF
jgi:hypothetical protein